MTNKYITSIKENGPYHQLVVIMPAYNEGEHIAHNLLEAAKIIKTFHNDFSIIAVNDGSKDNTEEEIIKASQKDPSINYISYSENKGKGGAIKEGVKLANGEYIAFLDSDLELPPIMLKGFLEALQKNNAHVAIGSKMHKDSKLYYPVIRKIMSLGYYFLLKLMFKLKIKDTQTGIKLFKQDVIKPICEGLITTGFAFDIEILATASKLGYKIIEMPITLNFSRERREKSRMTIKTIIKVFKDTLKIKKHIKQI